MIQDGISRRQIVGLASITRDPAISIYVPTARKGQEVQEGRIKLRNLLAQAEEMLTAQGMRRTRAIDLLSHARALDNDPDFWNDRLDSVAMFIGENLFEVFHLPFGAPEFLEIGTKFHVRPLLPSLVQVPRFYVLCLDKKNTRLLACGPRGVKEEKVEGMPTNLEKFVSVEHPEKEFQFHTVGPIGQAGTVIGHGAGDKSADVKEREQRFCLAITRVLEKHWADSPAPVVLAGTEELESTFRLHSKLPHLLQAGITGSSNLMDEQELRIAALPLVEAAADVLRQENLAHYKQVAETKFASSRIEDILPAATQGKVEVLFTDPSAKIWGDFDASSGHLSAHEERGEFDEELINEAAVETLKNSGTVYTATEDETGAGRPLAAIYRY